MQYIKSIEYFTIDENMTITANSSFSLIKTKNSVQNFSSLNNTSKEVPNKNKNLRDQNSEIIF